MDDSAAEGGSLPPSAITSDRPKSVASQGRKLILPQSRLPNCHGEPSPRISSYCCLVKSTAGRAFLSLLKSATIRYVMSVPFQWDVTHANKPWSRMLHLPEPFIPMSWISTLLPYLLAMPLRVLGDIMTQSSCCFWKCDRYSGWRFFAFVVQSLTSSLHTCLRPLSRSDKGLRKNSY